MGKQEGFWFSEQEPHFPHPQPQSVSWPGEADFLMALDRVEAHLAQSETGRVNYRGPSPCRLCVPASDKPFVFNGSREYRHPDWAWPEGFRHYIAVHHVRPTPEFEAWVLRENQALGLAPQAT